MSFSPSIVSQPSILEVWLDYCSKRGLTPDIIDPMKGQLFSIKETAQILGARAHYEASMYNAIGAFVYPLTTEVLQGRFLYGTGPLVPKVGADVKSKPAKYMIPKGAINVLYYPPHLTDWYADTKYTLLLVEGALNAVRLAAAGYHAVSIMGASNFRVVSKGPIIPELVKIVQSTQAEKIVILFDSDARNPEKVALGAAVNTLALELMRLRPDRKHTIYTCYPPAKPNGDKNGPDDYLNEKGIDEFNRMLREESQPFADHPFLINEAKAAARYVYEEFSGMYFDTKQRKSLERFHFSQNLQLMGRTEDPESPRAKRRCYQVEDFNANPSRRVAHVMTYRPDRDDIFFTENDVNYLNTFQPEDVPQPIKGDVSIVYKMLNSICRTTPAAVQKILCIAARHAQQPALIPKYGIIMLGETGSGKSSMARLIGKSLGKFTDIKPDLTKPYNATWRNHACKEWAEFDKNMDGEWLKDLITSETYEVCTKYGKEYSAPNHTLNIFTSNTFQSKVQKGDRRFVIAGEARADNKLLGLEFEAAINGPLVNHLRYHLVNEIDCSMYDALDIHTELTDAVIEASESYKSSVCTLVLEELAEIEGLECVPNVILEGLLEKHKTNTISFIKANIQHFIKPYKEMVKIDGTPYRFRAFANLDKWRNEEEIEAYREQFYLAQKLLKTQKY